MLLERVAPSKCQRRDLSDFSFMSNSHSHRWSLSGNDPHLEEIENGNLVSFVIPWTSRFASLSHFSSPIVSHVFGSLTIRLSVSLSHTQRGGFKLRVVEFERHANFLSMWIPTWLLQVSVALPSAGGG